MLAVYIPVNRRRQRLSYEQGLVEHCHTLEVHEVTDAGIVSLRLRGDGPERAVVCPLSAMDHHAAPREVAAEHGPDPHGGQSAVTADNRDRVLAFDGIKLAGSNTGEFRF
jgi:hypothetical protein